MRGRKPFRLAATVLVATGSLLGSAGLAAAASSAQPGVTVAARNLADPFGIAFSPGGRLFVAEAAAGRVSKTNLATSSRSTYLSGLRSIDAVDVGANGTVYALTGEGNGGPRDTRLFTSASPGHAKVAANLLAYELAHNPDGQSLKTPDSKSNPFAVLRLPGRTLVADGGANDVISVADSGRLSTFFAPRNINTGACAGRKNNDPQHPGCDPVPTGLALGPDGAVYVSGLGAFGPGAGTVWKLDAHTGRVMRAFDGFTALTGIAVGSDGSLYLSQLLYGAPAGEGPPPPGFDPSKVGRIIRVAPNGTRTYAKVTMPVGLKFYGGQLYSTAWSVATEFFNLPPGTGQVVKVSPSAFK
jgi:hypothetical protein